MDYKFEYIPTNKTLFVIQKFKCIKCSNVSIKIFDCESIDIKIYNKFLLKKNILKYNKNLYIEEYIFNICILHDNSKTFENIDSIYYVLKPIEDSYIYKFQINKENILLIKNIINLNNNNIIYYLEIIKKKSELLNNLSKKNNIKSISVDKHIYEMTEILK